MIRAAMLIVAKNWKSLKCPSIGDDLNKLGNVHTLEYHRLVTLYVVKWGHSQTICIFVSEKSKVQSSMYTMLAYVRRLKKKRERKRKNRYMCLYLYKVLWKDT